MIWNSVLLPNPAAPITGDSDYIIIIAVLVVAALAIVGILIKRKKK